LLLLEFCVSSFGFRLRRIKRPDRSKCPAALDPNDRDLCHISAGRMWDLRPYW